MFHLGNLIRQQIELSKKKVGSRLPVLMYRNNKKTVPLYCLVSPAPCLKKAPKKPTNQKTQKTTTTRKKPQQIDETEAANSYIPDLGT